MTGDPTPHAVAHEGRQLVLLCDGTNANLTGGERDTHVVMLAELLAAHPDPRRIVMYDPGVGNSATLLAAGWLDEWRRLLHRAESLANGRGVYENIVEAYAFLVKHWRPGDEIFVFGFSRGAFTARSVAGLVNRFGIVRSDADLVLETLLSIYFSGAPPRGSPVAEQATRLFTPQGAQKVRIQFVGVWDTVAALGATRFSFPTALKPTLAGKRFMNVRQALALDEHRRLYEPRVYLEPDGKFDTAFGDLGSVEQLWFRGSHADVGGQLPHDEAALGHAPLCWIVSEAVKCGLQLHAAGRKLDDEDAVSGAVKALHAHAHAHAHASAAAAKKAAPRGRPLLHSALHEHGLWAVTGLAPRDTRLRVEVGPALKMKEHRSVGEAGIVPSEWQRPRPRSWVVAFALVIGALAVLLAGQALMGGPANAEASTVLLEPWPRIAANIRFQHWQWLGIFDGSVGSGWFAHWRDLARGEFRLAPRALAWDFVFIACWATVLAQLVSRAFATCAGQRRAADGVSPWLRRLGLALPVAVMADVAENVASLATVTMLRAGWDVVPIATGVVMAVAALLKWAGLAGVVALVVWSLFVRRPAASAQSSKTQDDAPLAPVAAVGFVTDPKLPTPQLHAHDASHDGQRVVRDDGGFDRPAWANKKGDDLG